MSTRSLLALIAALAILTTGGLLWRSRTNTPTPDPSPSQISTATPTALPTTVQYPGEEGTDALTLLKRAHTVTEETSSFGAYVKGIDGQEADSDHYWAFYVNGEAASVGAAAYTTRASDTVEWRYEAIR